MRISVRELKARTGRVLKEVEDGGEVLLTKRGKPVARVVSLQRKEIGDWWGELKSAFARNRFKNADDAIAWMKGRQEKFS
jgi:prevent-host-death family protein